MTQKIDILVVDDEPVIVNAVEKILGGEGLSVDRAGTAQGGLEKLSRTDYQLVLVDLMLPRISGLDLLLAARARKPRTPVVMITGYATLDNAIRSFKSGAFDFIPKPFDAAELGGVVRRGLRFFEARRGVVGGTPGSDAPNGVSSAGEARPDTVYSLGEHAWARLQRPGMATVGVGETFRDTIRDFSSLALPRPNEKTSQGRSCANITTPDELLFRVWSPLSGTVLEVNERVISDPRRANTDPFSEGWLLKIRPTNLNSELADLLPI
jgi:CheY-like chemotaxis protein